MYFLMRQSKPISLLIGGYSRIKMISCWICERVWKTVKCQGKIREKSGNLRWMISGNPEKQETLIRSVQAILSYY